MIQLVVSGNRIVAHGEDCFLAMGGTVVCTATGRVFQNATVVNHDGAIPCDLDECGYEYHAGEFVYNSPFGTGIGLTLSYLPKIIVPIQYVQKMIYANGKFVVLGLNSIAYSVCDTTWVSHEISVSDAMDITYGNGVFVIVGKAGGTAYSTDLTNWTASAIPVTGNRDWLGVAYGNGRFVAISSDGYSSYSTDGDTWSDEHYTGSYYAAKNIVFANGVFVTAFSDTSYSADGENWTLGGEVPVASSNDYGLKMMKYLGGAFVGIDINGDIWYTTDYKNDWTSSIFPDAYIGVNWDEIDFKDGMYVAIAYGYSAQTTNISGGWEVHSFPYYNGVAVTNNGKKFVAVRSANASSIYEANVSKDGIDWSIRGKYRIRTPGMVDVTDTVKSVLGL